MQRIIVSKADSGFIMQNAQGVPRSILSEPYAVDLILYLNIRGEMMATQFRKIHSNYPKMIALGNKLEEMGLFEIEEERTPRVMYIYRLTEKGKMVAEKLKEIEEIVGGDGDE